MNMYKTTLLQAFVTPIQFHVSTEYMYTPTLIQYITLVQIHMSMNYKFSPTPIQYTGPVHLHESTIQILLHISENTITPIEAGHPDKTGEKLT